MSEQTESTPLLIHFDESKYKYQIESLEEFIPNFFEREISKFNDLGIGTFKNEYFISLFTSPKEFLFNQLMKDKPLEVAGMKVSKEKLFELLEKPAGYYNLIILIENFQKKAISVLNYVFKRSDLDYFLSLFEFDADDKIQVTSETKAKIKFQNEIYVSKESSKAIFNLFKDLEKLFNESAVIIENTRQPFYLIGDFIRSYLPFMVSEKKYRIDIEAIKRFDNTSQR